MVASPEERETRVRRFRNLRQRDYDNLLKSVKSIIYNQRIAEDAFAHAMVVAAEHYDGRASLKYFVMRVARNYAINESEKRQWETVFADLEPNNNPPDHSTETVDRLCSTEERLGSKEDDYNLGFFGEEFARRVARLLKSTAADTILTGPVERTHARRAAVLFDAIVQSVRDDTGLGIDEYECDECVSENGRKNTRTEFEERVAALLSKVEGRPLKKKTTEEVTTYLRRKVRDILSHHPHII
jgi:DNA-directed RNA polymerase specialized sigma24 family protein